MQVSSSALPAGAATSANQTNVQSAAGVSAATATAVQGVAGGVPQNVTGAVSISNFPTTQPVSGTVTANAGTNLNTSALALESGGNLAAINSKLPAQGQALAAASIPVVLPAAQITTLTPPTSVGVTQATASALNATVVNAGTFAVQNTAAVVGGNALAVKTDSSATTQPVSATALPLPAGAATSANQTNGTQQTKITDGTNVVGVAAASTAASAAQPAEVVALSPNTPLPAGSNTLGTVAVQNASFTGAGYLNVNVGSSTFSYSANNSTNGFSTAYSLTTGNSWTGTLENTINQVYLITAVNSSQNVTVTISQFIDAAASVKEVPDIVFSVAAGVPLPITVAVDGNYVRISVSNSSGSTATLYVDSYYGSLPVQPYSLTQLGNYKNAIQEWNVSSGTVLGNTGTLGQNGTTIASATNQFPVQSNNSEVKLSSSFVRPANTTAYVSGYLVANNTVAASVVPLTFTNTVRSAGDCVRLERLRLTKTSTSLTNAGFKVHIFESLPTPTVGDGAAFDASGVLATTGALNYVGSFTVTMNISGSDGASGRALPDTGFALTCSPTSGTSLYGLIEATAAYTPTSGETFTAVLEGFRP